MTSHSHLSKENQQRINEIEIVLLFIKERRESYISRQCYQTASILRYEEQKLYIELEELTDQGYLRSKWGITEINNYLLPPKE